MKWVLVLIAILFSNFSVTVFAQECTTNQDCIDAGMGDRCDTSTSLCYHKMDPRGTFLRTYVTPGGFCQQNSDNNIAPLIIELASIGANGVQGGDLLTLTVHGDANWSCNPIPPGCEQTIVHAIFSSSDTVFFNGNAADRVPDKVGSVFDHEGDPVSFVVTNPCGQSCCGSFNDIPSDFTFDDTHGNYTLVVPIDIEDPEDPDDDRPATHLVLGVNGGFPGDNTDTDNDFGLRVEKACVPADVNCDGYVTGTDIGVIRNPINFNMSCSAADNPRADVNRDGNVTGTDIGVVQNPLIFNSGDGEPCHCVAVSCS